MANKCEYFEKCSQVFNYRNGLESPDKIQTYFINSICLNEGSEICISKQKSLDEKVEENSDE